MIKLKDVIGIINKNQNALILINRVTSLIIEDKLECCKSCGGQGIAFGINNTEFKFTPFECSDCNGHGYIIKE